MAAVPARRRARAGARGDQGARRRRRPRAARGARRATTCSTGWPPTTAWASTGPTLDALLADPLAFVGTAPHQVAAFVGAGRAGRGRATPTPPRYRPNRSSERPALTVTSARPPPSGEPDPMTDLGLPHVYSGKVRDIYDVGDDRLLMVTSRPHLAPSTWCMDEPIPDKGRVLTAMSAFWFDAARRRRAGSHLVSTDLADLPRRRGGRRRRPGRPGDARAARPRCCRSSASCGATSPARRGRSTARRAPCTARALPDGPAGVATSCPSRCSRRRPRPTSATTTRTSRFDAGRRPGRRRAGRARPRDVSLELYRRGADWAAERGIIIADTKFELGLVDGELVLCDEVLTPDSSRFWPADAVGAGHHAAVVRQAAGARLPRRPRLGQDARRPPPLPDEVVAATSARYIEAYERITGRSFADWPGASGSTSG